MTYFGFNEAAPTDLVNVVTDLNDSWDSIDSKLFPLQSSDSVYTNIDKGFESFQSQRVAVWDGTTWRYSDSIPLAWGAWTNLPLASVVERPSWTPKYRINSQLKLVQLTGAVLFNSGASAWPNSSVTISGGVTGIGIDNQYLPVNGKSIQNTASSAISTEDGFASASVNVYDYTFTPGSPVGIDLMYLGDPGGGNFIVLDGIRWWYE